MLFVSDSISFQVESTLAALLRAAGSVRREIAALSAVEKALFVDEGHDVQLCALAVAKVQNPVLGNGKAEIPRRERDAAARGIEHIIPVCSGEVPLPVFQRSGKHAVSRIQGLSAAVRKGEEAVSLKVKIQVLGSQPGGSHRKIAAGGGEHQPAALHQVGVALNIFWVDHAGVQRVLKADALAFIPGCSGIRDVGRNGVQPLLLGHEAVLCRVYRLHAITPFPLR